MLGMKKDKAKMKNRETQGPRRGRGWGALAPPLPHTHFFGGLRHYFFNLSKPGLSFTNKVQQKPATKNLKVKNLVA